MNPNVLLAVAFLPLVAAILAGLFGRYIGRAGAHLVTIAAVAAELPAVARGAQGHLLGWRPCV